MLVYFNRPHVLNHLQFNHPLNLLQANNRFLLYLQRGLKKEDRNLKEFGFPEPLQKETELETEMLLLIAL